MTNRQPTPALSIRDEYAAHGVDDFYAQQGDDYSNPHEEQVGDALAKCVARWELDLAHVLDLACGSGEMTLRLRQLGADQIVGVDPFTGAAYRRRTGQDALPHSFEQIAAGELSDRRYSLIVCSYALHLVEPSRLPGLLWQLGILSPALLILSPHKRPVIREDWGWQLAGELYHRRVRVRLLKVPVESSRESV